MAWVCPDVGEVEMAKRMLYGNAGSENFTLKIFANSITPAESDTAASYTVASFTGYSNKTLTSSQSGATWAVPTTSGGVTSSAYGTNMNWLPTTSETVYGLYIVGATSTVLLFVDAFAAAKPLANGDSLTVTPVLAVA